MSFPRRSSLDLADQEATEPPDYPGTETIDSEFCGSAYEDAKSNYLVDYAFDRTSDDVFAEILGYDPSGVKVFGYMYKTQGLPNRL